MRIHCHLAKLPDLTVDEANRQWLTPDNLLILSGLDDSIKAEYRKFLANISDRGFVAFEKSGTAKTSPRLYPMTAAVKLRTMWEITRSGRTLEFASEIGNSAIHVLCGHIKKYDDVGNIPEFDCMCLYNCLGLGYKPDMLIVDSDEFHLVKLISMSYDVGVIQVGEISRRIISDYASFWAEDLLDKGEVTPNRYRGVHPKGFPLDPYHPWNVALPPEERTERLIEIERYISEREKMEQTGRKKK